MKNFDDYAVTKDLRLLSRFFNLGPTVRSAKLVMEVQERPYLIIERYLTDSEIEALEDFRKKQLEVNMK